MSPVNECSCAKFRFDEHVGRRVASRSAQIAGVRYLNVYGPNEQHKGRMASVAFHAFNQYLAEGAVKLFIGSHGFGDGEQRRDFVHVDDVVSVNLHFLDHPEISGIYNCGTGRAQSFNDVAMAVVNGVRGGRGEPALTLAQLVEQRQIEYIPFPPRLAGKYQSFTEADLSQLRAAGYSGEFQSVEQGVGSYVRHMLGRG